MRHEASLFSTGLAALSKFTGVVTMMAYIPLPSVGEISTLLGARFPSLSYNMYAK